MPRASCQIKNKRLKANTPQHSTMAATINAIEQGQCTECETDVVENYSVVQRIVADTGIWRHVRCDCGAEGVVRIHEDGLSVGGPISHEQASWNQQRK